MAGGLLWASPGWANVATLVEHNGNGQATASFAFAKVPGLAPARAGSGARFILVDGEADENSGGLAALNDGKLPRADDEPSDNFFFKADSDGGRLLIDLGKPTELAEINTYSWHPGARGPQVYSLYAMDDTGPGRNDRPKRGTDPLTAGWKLLAKVDTRPNNGDAGGQYGVRLSDTSGNLGTFRYLLFDISRTEDSDGFGNTFYSEIELVDSNGQRITGQVDAGDCLQTLQAMGLYRITIDSCTTPDLAEWAKTNLAPVVLEWYPKLVALLPSDGYEAPKEVSIRFSDQYRGVAATGGTRITCAAKWFRANLKGEAVGSVVHELVHVVQQYGRARRTNPEATRSPGWLVEGLADYLRWFVYEPQSHGADLAWLRQRKNVQLRYDAGYRLTANFLNWVSEKYDQGLVKKLNAAMREEKYRETLWSESTGHSLADLGAEWKQQLEQQLN